MSKRKKERGRESDVLGRSNERTKEGTILCWGVFNQLLLISNLVTAIVAVEKQKHPIGREKAGRFGCATSQWGSEKLWDGRKATDRMVEALKRREVPLCRSVGSAFMVMDWSWRTCVRRLAKEESEGQD